MTHNRSKQQLEDDGTSVAPPQCLRSQTVPQPQPLSGSSRQQVELQTAVTADESESIDKDETDKNDKNYSRKGEEDSIVNDDSVQGDKKKQRVCVSCFISLLEGIFFLFQHLPLLSRCFIFIFISILLFLWLPFPYETPTTVMTRTPLFEGFFLISAGPLLLQ